MIILTGKELKSELQVICDENEIVYSKLDSKDRLLEKIETFNKMLEVAGAKDKVEIKKEIKENKFEEDVKKITGSQYCNINGHNKRTHFFIEKKYKQDKYSINEWDIIFKKEKLV